MKLSIIIPVYNESKTFEPLLNNVLAVKLPMEKEIIIVESNSTDGTREIAQRLAKKHGLKLVLEDRPTGKGAAIVGGIKEATGDIIVVQDADLEYDPSEYPILLRPILDGSADVVYGSRFMGKYKASHFSYHFGNVFLTLIASMLYLRRITDIETCYKFFKADIIKSIPLRSKRFDFDPEVTAKLIKRGYRIHEVPISYECRDKPEGKKLKWSDGVVALWCLIKYRFVD